MLQYLFAMLPVAATCGWLYGRKSSKRDSSQRVSFKLRLDYFKGLNYLINEQPDKAVDVFIRLLEVDSDTVETHLALGSLFRRRGEVERAIRIHQNIIARPNLSARHRVQALSELAQDYLRAGVLDRAERLFLEVVEQGGEQKHSSYRFLLNIYQQEKDWPKAIEISQKLQGLGEPVSTEIAHYYCEIAQALLARKEVTNALVNLKKAQSNHAACVRASILRAEVEENQKNYKAAIAHYQKVVAEDVAYISEVIKPMVCCYRELGHEEKMMTYFRECLSRHPHISLVLAISDALQRDESDGSALNFIAEQVRRKPSLAGIKHLVTSYLTKSSEQTQKRLDVIGELMARLLESEPSYRCAQCGFSCKSLFWLCPSCHHWSSIKPIQGND